MTTKSCVNRKFTQDLVVMKANFNQRGLWMVGAVIFTAGSLSIFNLPKSGPAVPVKATVEPVVRMLLPGMTGAEIQEALNSLPANGGEVVLPPGTFSIRQPIVLRRDFQTLRGSGAATVLRLADDANCPVLILGEPVNTPRQLSLIHISEP